jgi:UDP-GlcNAc:undecaprenyl-phosphate GlcNAc-1-phosphate transferase
MPLILASLGALLLSLILTPLVRAAAHRLGMVAAPRADRWHERPTAVLGGIAIYVAFMAGYALLAPKLPSAFPILVAGSLLFLTGLVDDFVHLTPSMKLIFQLVAAAATVYAGLYLP